MGRYRWLSSNCCPACAWVRLAHVSAASLCLVSPYIARFPGASRQFDDIFGYGPRWGRPHQFLALSARAPLDANASFEGFGSCWKTGIYELSCTILFHSVNPVPIPVPRLIPALLLLVAIGPQTMEANSQHGSCLARAEHRAAVDDHKAISLGQAIKSLRQYRKYSEVVRARLCRRDDKLVYVLTLLGRSGKVVDVTIDAINGEFNAGS